MESGSGQRLVRERRRLGILEARTAREHVQLDLGGRLVGERGSLVLGRPELLGKRHALGGVVGGREDLVGELTEVVEQPLALVPEQLRVDDDLLRVLVGLLAQELCLAVGALDAPLGLRARARSELVRRLVRALQDAGCLLADLIERALHDGLARLPALELGDQIGDLIDEVVDRLPVVAAHR